MYIISHVCIYTTPLLSLLLSAFGTPTAQCYLNIPTVYVGEVQCSTTALYTHFQLLPTDTDCPHCHNTEQMKIYMG